MSVTVPTGGLSSDSLPLTVLVPDSGAGSIEVYDQHAALKMAVTERDQVGRVGTEWDLPGVYILLDRHNADGTWGVYAGKAPAGIKNRLGGHVRQRDHWCRAVLVRRDTTFGFNSAQAGYLEGRLYDVFHNAEEAVLHNGNRPSDETLPPYDRQMLDLAILPVRRVLQMIGHDPSTADSDGVRSTATRTSRFFGIALSDIIEAGLLAPGTALVSTNGAWPASATVHGDGSIEYGDRRHGTPSAAATAVKNGPANGWDFWAVEDSSPRVTLADLRSIYSEQHPQEMPT